MRPLLVFWVECRFVEVVFFRDGAFRCFLWIPRILTELRSEKFEWFGPSPIEPFNSGKDCARVASAQAHRVGRCGAATATVSEAAAPGFATLQSSRVDSTSEADAAASRLAAEHSAACVSVDFDAQDGGGEISRTAPPIAATATVPEAAAPGLATQQGSCVDSTFEADAAASRLAAE